MFINEITQAFYNFIAPKISDDANKKVTVQFPTYEKIDCAITSNKAEANVQRTKQLVVVGSSALAAACTLTATPSEDLEAGSEMYVKFSCGATAYNVTVKKNSDDTGVALTGVSSSIVTKHLIWDGSNWILIA